MIVISHDELVRTAAMAIRSTGGTSARLDAAVRAAAKTGSPIEAIFATCFVVARDHLLSQGQPRFVVALRPQAWVGGYRLDFALEPSDPWLTTALADAGLSLRVGVELDGHGFHERTPEQVMTRDRRDRDLSGLGWRILHFSGAELHANPMWPVVDTLVAGADALDQAKAAFLHG